MKSKPKNEAASALGSRRMAKLTKKQRSALGKKAAKARWTKEAHAARVAGPQKETKQ